MNHDQDVLVQFTINDQGEVQFNLAPLPSDSQEELVFTPIEEGRPAIRRPMSNDLKKWLKTAKPVTLDQLQKIMDSSPSDASTISPANQLPS
jgi:hypothetical protein